MLFNEPKLLKLWYIGRATIIFIVSVLFNEPKLLKCNEHSRLLTRTQRFSALQRAEIAEMAVAELMLTVGYSFSALQRAEIAEIERGFEGAIPGLRFQCSSTSRNC